MSAYTKLTLVCVGSVLTMSCGEGVTAPDTEEILPTLSVSDALHDGAPASQHAFFLSPISNPRRSDFNGSFDPYLNPVVIICEWDGTGEWDEDDCRHLVTFTTDHGRLREGIRVSKRRQRYEVWWASWKYHLDSDMFYRIRILVGAVEVAHADVDVWSRWRERRRIDPEEYVALGDRAHGMWIRFRLEEGLLSCVDLPTPVLTFTESEDYIDGFGDPFTRYLIPVMNWSDFPVYLFELTPDYGACGMNENPSRTWVEIFSDDGSRLYGFCGIDEPEGLQTLWFGVPQGTAPPESVYIEMNDRACGITVTSNLVDLP